jgi:hypothetical protein
MFDSIVKTVDITRFDLTPINEHWPQAEGYTNHSWVKLQFDPNISANLSRYNEPISYPETVSPANVRRHFSRLSDFPANSFLNL